MGRGRILGKRKKKKKPVLVTCMQVGNVFGPHVPTDVTKGTCTHSSCQDLVKILSKSH